MNKINEGFWDAVVAKSQRVSAAVGSAVGNRSARGKLSALNLADDFYNAFKVWLSSTGAEEDASSMSEFLSTEVGLNQDFSDTWGNFYDEFAADPESFLAADPVEVEQGPESEEKGEQTPDPKTPEQPGGEDSDGDSVPPLDRATFNAFKRHTIGSGFTGSRNGYKFNKSPDGSFIVVGDNEVDDFETIMDWNVDSAELASELNDAGMMKRWEDFKAVNAKYGDGNKIARDAMMAAADKLGKNYIKELNRFILMTPKEAVPFELKESVIFESGPSDSQLRKFFLKAAQHALRTGAAKSAATHEIKRARLKPSAKRQADDAISKAKAPDAPSAQSSAEPAKAGGTVEVKLAGLNLSDQNQQLLADLEADRNPGLASMVTVPSDKETERLAKLIIQQALRDYRSRKVNK
jgi:hypothetical protein